MKNAFPELRDVIQKCGASTRENFDLIDDFEKQVDAIISLRRIFSIFPNQRLKHSDRHNFIKKKLGRNPTEDELSIGLAKTRKRRLTNEESLEIEKRQNGRCRLCGIILANESNPQVDHIFPISLGGEDSVENFQLLCGRCNQGKGNLIHWLMAMPFFDESNESEPTLRMRYSVLERFGGRCTHIGCNLDSRSTEMLVVTDIDVPDGGRIIFDNLVVLCTDHFEFKRREQTRRARYAVSGRKGFGF